jgi:hypothetical protein
VCPFPDFKREQITTITQGIINVRVSVFECGCVSVRVSGGCETKSQQTTQRFAWLGPWLCCASLASHKRTACAPCPCPCPSASLQGDLSPCGPDLGVQVLRLHAGHRTVEACQCSVAASRLILTCRQVHASLNWIALGRSRHTILPVTLSSHNASVCSVEEPKAG